MEQCYCAEAGKYRLLARTLFRDCSTRAARGFRRTLSGNFCISHAKAQSRKERDASMTRCGKVFMPTTVKTVNNGAEAVGIGRALGEPILAYAAG
jgi:hypothetical protein